MQTRDTFDRAIAEDHEAAHLREQLQVLRRDEGAAREGLERLRARHVDELADVERLEGFGLTAVLAAVRGTRTGELDRERAEEVAARYAAQTALARLQSVAARREEVERRLAQLGDTTARREAAADSHATALRASGASAAPELEPVLDELAAVRAEAAELAQARDAGVRAAAALDAARNELGSADSWSAYDTWFGGGLISSMVKHDRIDAAGRSIAAAQDALVDLARELDDVQGVTGLRADLGISPSARTFDVWFDNVFSDLSVRSSIKDSVLRVDTAVASVREAMARLGLRGAALDQRLADLTARRDELLSRRG
ncbi:MAG TPA: hypothetical protein VFL10_06495 [Ornithinibacter sp.]|nr:hypothetical protein [Ornithinibacter sp.]